MLNYDLISVFSLTGSDGGGREKEKKAKKEIIVDEKARDTQKQTARNQRDEHEPDGEKTGRETS